MSPKRVTIGRVGRSHGIRGAFVVESASENETLFEPGATLLAGGEPATVEERKRGGGGRLVIRLDRPVERGTLLELDRDALPPPGEDRYYVFDLVGLEVVDDAGRRLGRVRDVDPGVANDVLVLDSGVLLPMHEECVLSVSLEERRILVARGFAEPE